MKQSLMERLEILESADLIDADVFAFCEKVVNYFLEKTSEWPQENMEIFITHLAMAASRSKKGEAEETLDDSIKTALKQEEIYSEAKTILEFTFLIQKLICFSSIFVRYVKKEGRISNENCNWRYAKKRNGFCD